MNRVLLLLIFFINFSFAQWFTLDHEGVIRSYYVSFPADIHPEENIPLIINMHGYGGNAEQQQTYSEMDIYAHPQNIAVVYPQGLNNSWNVFTYWDSNFYDDVGFISTMLDEIDNNFNIDEDRIYACGMSNGGYMAYRLACDLSDKIAVFGSVTGNFMLQSGDLQDCIDQEREIPIIHFHGTADLVVNYAPPSFDGSLTVSESIDFWSSYNSLDSLNINSINENVDLIIHFNDLSTKFVHYKVYGGGHEWFGSSWATNWGVNTSEELINFFLQYKLSDFFNAHLSGDINDDGIVNIQDVILIINLVLNDNYIDIGDLNNDNEIDVLDVVILVNLILSTI